MGFTKNSESKSEIKNVSMLPVLHWLSGGKFSANIDMKSEKFDLLKHAFQHQHDFIKYI